MTNPANRTLRQLVSNVTLIAAFHRNGGELNGSQISICEALVEKIDEIGFASCSPRLQEVYKAALVMPVL